MLFRSALAFLLAASACTWEMTIGRGSGVLPFRFEKSVENPSRTGGGRDMLIVEDVDVFDAERAAQIRDNVGPDRIGSIRAVTLTVTEMRIDGLDLGRTGPPQLGLLGRPVEGVVGASFELSDHEVDVFRDHLLAGRALPTTLSISVHIPEGAADESLPYLHVALEVQPTLVVDASKSF
jgi:hypothetical protein